MWDHIYKCDSTFINAESDFLRSLTLHLQVAIKTRANARQHPTSRAREQGQIPTFDPYFTPGGGEWGIQLIGAYDKHSCDAQR